jgi:hypothetical protein
LGDTKAVHAEYFDVKVHLVDSTKVGYEPSTVRLARPMAFPISAELRRFKF